MPSSSLPKLSYVLLSHNREKYIRGAIESAFAQDYEGELEYIFSDDCSTDRTFEIIKECVAAYKGNRRVVVTQTPKNLHLAGNTNHAVQFVTSDWIVRADDDDFSTINRCSIIGDAIMRYPQARYIALPITYFTASECSKAKKESLIVSKTIPSFSMHNCKVGDIPIFKGGALSYKVWHVDVFRIFSHLPLSACYTDDYIAFIRASVLGLGIHVYGEPTVLALKDASSMCHGGIDSSSVFKNRIQYEQFLDRYYNMSFSPLQETFAEVKQYVRNNYTYTEKQAASRFLLSIEEAINRMSDLRLYWRRNTLYRIKVTNKYHRWNIFNILRVLPLPIFATSFAMLKRIQMFFR